MPTSLNSSLSDALALLATRLDPLAPGETALVGNAQAELIAMERNIQALTQIAEMATARGWNGVTNSKILSVFLSRELEAGGPLGRSWWLPALCSLTCWPLTRCENCPAARPWPRQSVRLSGSLPSVAENTPRTHRLPGLLPNLLIAALKRVPLASPVFHLGMSLISIARRCANCLTRW